MGNDAASRRSERIGLSLLYELLQAAIRPGDQPADRLPSARKLVTATVDVLHRPLRSNLLHDGLRSTPIGSCACPGRRSSPTKSWRNCAQDACPRASSRRSKIIDCYDGPMSEGDEGARVAALERISLQETEHRAIDDGVHILIVSDRPSFGLDAETASR